MSDFLNFSVSQELNNERIDKAIVTQFGTLTRSAIQRLIEQNMVTVDGEEVNKNYRVKTGEDIEVTVPEPQELEAEAQDIPLEIPYEDNDLLVVNKPKGMVVHPAAGNLSNTLVNALLFHCKGSLSGINGVIRPGIVHRIDKDTSGLLIIAKNDFAHINLAQQIKEHSFTREYRAVVHGNLKQDKATIDAPIGRNKNDRKKMCVTKENSREAVTNYEVIERYNGYTYIKVRLETGRTHQIRVHMAYVGHPVAGDLVYGPRNTPTELHGQCLHAGLLGFVHPRTQEYMEISSELPEYFEKFLKKLNHK
ncbi:MAG: RluA family pseudouridine synthase [Oscillospiraceae bacterium]